MCPAWPGISLWPFVTFWCTGRCSKYWATWRAFSAFVIALLWVVVMVLWWQWQQRHLYYSVSYSVTRCSLPLRGVGRWGDYAYVKDKVSKLRKFEWFFPNLTVILLNVFGLPMAGFLKPGHISSILFKLFYLTSSRLPGNNYQKKWKANSIFFFKSKKFNWI